MQAANIPAKFGVAWAANAATTGGPNGDGYKRTPPAASQIGVHDGFASFADGFPPLNAQPVASGGVPPYIQDTNGVLGLVTAWDQWVQAGGPVTYDAAFATAMGGYPKGALLISAANPGITWQSTADGNTSNPDGSSPSGWITRAVATTSLSALPLDAVGDGGRLTLKGSGSNADAVVGNYSGTIVLSAGNGIGMTYSPGSYTLAVGHNMVGTISSVSFTASPNTNGDHIYYFVDGGGNMTGHVLQDSAGMVHINSGTAEVTIDPSGGLAASSLNVGGGEVTNAGALVTTAAGGASLGTAGLSSTGPATVTTNLNLYGKNIEMYSGSIAAGGSLTAQIVYNDVTPKTNGPQTELWCQNACLWVDSAGGGYIRASIGSPNTFGKITTSAASERRLKRDIVPLDGEAAMAALRAAPPSRWRYTPESGHDPAPWHVGGMYDETLAAMPEATTRAGGVGQLCLEKGVPYLQAALLWQGKLIAAMADRLAVLEARR